LYLALAYFLLPSLAVTLKVRKRKLAQTAALTGATDLVDNSSSVLDSTKLFVSTMNNKLSFESDSSESLFLKSQLNLLALKAESFQRFNFNIVGQAQLTAIFYV